MNQFSKITIVALVVLSPFLLFCQDYNGYISNPSFEGEPRRGGYMQKMDTIDFLKGWEDCGRWYFKDHSQPDIHSEHTQFWNVQHKPSHGNTFLSFVVREDGSWESTSQRLKTVLDPKRCYTLSIDLCKSQDLQSMVRNKGKLVLPYNQAVVLFITGGKMECISNEILVSTPPIENEDWQTYEFYFQPQSYVEYITVMAHFEDCKEPYSGNILLDNMTDIREVDCKK